MSFRVRRVEYHTPHDPLMPARIRYHNAIFVETELDGNGRAIQVAGAIGQRGGMNFQHKSVRNPAHSESFYRKHFLGFIEVGTSDVVVNVIKT